MKRHFVVALVSALALAGCAGASTQLPSTLAADPSLRFVDAATVKPQIYVTNYVTTGGAVIDDFLASDKKTGKPFCTLAVGLGVNAIGVDASGELWVPEAANAKSGAADVLSFAPNCGKAGKTLTGLKGQPAGIAFNSTGITYVNDILGTSSGAGNVAIFAKGATKPSKFLTNTQAYYYAAIGLDSSDNLYVSYYTSALVGGILEFAKGKGTGTPLKLANTLGDPGTPVFDSKDNMAISDDSTDTEYIYASPYTKTPKSFKLKGASPECSLDKAETTLACGDKTNTSVDLYDYPSGKYLYSLTNGLSSAVIGVAQDPR